MKTGNRKFLGFVITIGLYTAVLILVVITFKGLVVNLEAFAVQASIGFCGISGLFFTSNVLEHFANKGSNEH